MSLGCRVHSRCPWLRVPLKKSNHRLGHPITYVFNAGRRRNESGFREEGASEQRFSTHNLQTTPTVEKFIEAESTDFAATESRHPSLLSEPVSGHVNFKNISIEKDLEISAVKPREALETGRYADQIARFLPSQPSEQERPPTLKRTKRHGKHKEDKLLWNKLLKDKGHFSYDWRIPLSQLERHYNIEKKEPSNERLDLVRQVRISPITYSSRGLPSSLPQPTEWSQTSFTNYVKDLVALKPPRPAVSRLLGLEMNKDGPPTIPQAVGRLQTLLHSPKMRKFLTIEACNIALQFLYDKSMMSKARALYLRMEHLCMEVSTLTFNILLRGSASQKDLHNFAFLLQLMLKRGFRPNEETWVIFLMAIDSKSVRARVVQKMRDRKILEKTSVRRDVVSLIARDEVADFMTTDQNMNKFIDHMDNRYGHGWLSTSSANVILDEVGKRLSTSDSLQILYQMKQLGLSPNDYTMSTLLYQCLDSRRHDLTIEILDMFERHWYLHPKQTSHEALFIQAWRGRLLNFTKVVWISACIHGFVTYKMQNLVMQSLLFSTSLKAYTSSPDRLGNVDARLHSRSETYKRIAGNFIVGVDITEIDRKLGKSRSLSEGPKKQPTSCEELAVMTNLATAGQGYLRRGLVDLLRDALTLDKAWAAAGLWQDEEMQRKINSSLPVDIIRHHQASPRSVHSRKILGGKANNYSVISEKEETKE